MGKMQRRKGAVGEREVCEIFSAALNRDIKRNIGQARDGGNDIDVGPLVVEVKRRKTLGTIYGWMQQALAAAIGRGAATPTSEPKTLYPVVVFRQDGDTSWMVMLRLNDFLKLTRDELMAYLEESK